MFANSAYLQKKYFETSLRKDFESNIFLVLYSQIRALTIALCMNLRIRRIEY